MAREQTWMIVECEPATGRVTAKNHGTSLTDVKTADVLLRLTGYDVAELAKYAVGAADSLRQFASAERWLEDHPQATVVAAWSAGGPAARRKRQAEMHEYWPALARALDNLEVNGAEA